MPCLFVVLGLAVPRLTLVLLWLFTTWTRVIDSALIGIAGFLLAPYTTLAYVTLGNVGDGQVEGALDIVVLVIAVLADLGAYGGASRKKSD